VQRDHEVEHLVAMGMTLVPEKRELFGEMSVEDNLLLGAFQRYRHGDATTTRPWTRSSRPSRA
jgi:branched-chain amino acid transport system ATP-binding protein